MVRGRKNLARVAVTVAVLSAAGALRLIWHSFEPIRSMLEGFHVNLPLVTRLAVKSPPVLSVIIVILLASGILNCRQPRGLLFVALLGPIELGIAVAYFLALWLPAYQFIIS